MAKNKSTQTLSVFMNGSAVGRLERELSGALSFTYVREWLDHSQPIPLSRSFPLREKPYIGPAVGNYFDNLLPDDLRVRERIAARAEAGGIQAFDILAAIGRDCVGALQFYPERDEPGSVRSIKGQRLTDVQIADLLKNLRVNPLGISREKDFRISLAGAQSKTALLLSNNEWLLPEGATPTTHILKPAIGPLPDGPDLSLSVENEWLCLKILKAFGLKVANAEMSEFEGLKALVVERFDRKWSGRKLYRLPQEDICQAMGLGPDLKYESDGGPGIQDILNLLNESDTRDEDRQHFMMSQLIFWMLAAIDGHAKNFSIFLRPKGFGLTPLYDILSADPHVNRKTLPMQKLKLAMSVGESRHYRVQEILPRHWHQTATKSKFHAMEDIIQEVSRMTPKVVSEVQDQIPKKFPKIVSESILSGLTRRSKILEKR